jgi:hypothetical protein
VKEKKEEDGCHARAGIVTRTAPGPSVGGRTWDIIEVEVGLT